MPSGGEVPKPSTETETETENEMDRAARKAERRQRKLAAQQQASEAPPPPAAEAAAEVLGPQHGRALQDCLQTGVGTLMDHFQGGDISSASALQLLDTCGLVPRIALERLRFMAALATAIDTAEAERLKEQEKARLREEKRAEREAASARAQTERMAAAAKVAELMAKLQTSPLSAEDTVELARLMAVINNPASGAPRFSTS